MTGPDIREQIAERNRALHEDQVLTERIRGLIHAYLRPPGSGLPEPTAGHPPRLAVGPTIARPQRDSGGSRSEATPARRAAG